MQKQEAAQQPTPQQAEQALQVVQQALDTGFVGRKQEHVRNEQAVTILRAFIAQAGGGEDA